MSSITIDANYEGGNIEIVTRKSQNHFILKPVAKGGESYNLWFYFRIKGGKGREIWFEILEIDTINQFPERIKPVYSTDRKKWYRIQKVGLDQREKSLFFKLLLPSNEVFIAYGFPYTYSDLCCYLQKIQKNASLKIHSLITTEAGNAIFGVCIPKEKVSLKERKGIFIICRQHAGESPSSFVCEGIIDTLLSDATVSLRKKYTFYIVPMVDVDGVIRGLNGKYQKPIDFNRDWQLSLHREIKILKECIQNFADEYDFQLFLDIHSPSLYGEGNYYSYIFSKEECSQEYFRQQIRFLSLLERNSLPHNSFSAQNFVHYDHNITWQTAQGYIMQKYKVTATTIEVPFHFINNNKMMIDEGRMREFGKIIIHTISDFLGDW